jgi:hypothetical protein
MLRGIKLQYRYSGNHEKDTKASVPEKQAFSAPIGQNRSPILNKIFILFNYVYTSECLLSFEYL